MIKISDPGIKTKYTVTDFENAIKKYVGYPFAVATNTGTAALHLALLSLGVNRGSEISIPAICFRAIYNVVKLTGASVIFHNEPPFYDHGIDVMNYGFPSKTKGNEIIDAAEALGGAIPKNYQYCILSFNWNKPVTCGSGGMVLCQTRDVEEELRYFANQAKMNSEYFIHGEDIASNYRMNDIQASMGMEWFKKLPETTAMRKAIYERYLKAKLPIVRPPKGFKWNYWITLMRTPHRERIFDAFRKNDIECRAMFTPHTREFPEENKYAAEVMCLPSSPGLTREEQDFVIKVVKENL